MTLLDERDTGPAPDAAPRRDPVRLLTAAVAVAALVALVLGVLWAFTVTDDSLELARQRDVVLVLAGGGVVAEQAAQALERGEAPDLLATRGSGVRLQVEGRLRVEVGLHVLGWGGGRHRRPFWFSGSQVRGVAGRPVSRPSPPSAAR